MTQLKSLPSRRAWPPLISYEQFLNWDGESRHVEWVNGEVIPMPPISGEHFDVGHYLARLLGEFLDDRNLGVLKGDPFQMKTGPDLPGRAPDLMFIARRNLRRLHKTHLEGPADLVIEIISPGSRIIDTVDKFKEYEQAGVREYWLIDPPRRQLDVYRLGRDGHFGLAPIGSDGVVRCNVMKGLWLQADWLWDRPALRVVRKAWGMA